MRLILTLLFLILFSPAYTQNYRNEWINFPSAQDYSSQQYFRMEIWKPGIYRVGYNELQIAGVPVSTWFDPGRYQIFHEGEEQYITVADVNSDNIFGPGDYLQFYGEQNRGELDTYLYDTLTSQPNRSISLFNDTAAYYITYNPFTAVNRRISTLTDLNFSGYSPETWFYEEQRKDYIQEYNIGFRDYDDIADNSYTRAEGYYSGRTPYTSSVGPTFSLSNYLSLVAAPEAEVLIAGANANFHPYEIKGNGQTQLSNTVIGYEMVKHQFQPSNLPGSGNYNLQLSPQVDNTNPFNDNFMQLAYARIRYPRDFNLASDTLPRYLELAAAQKVMISPTGLTQSDYILYLFSPDTIYSIAYQLGSGSLQALIPYKGAGSRVYLSRESLVLSGTANYKLSPVNSDPDPARFARFRNLSVLGAGVDFLMVSHPAIWQTAMAYRDYKALNGLNPLLVDINELYDQFAWGVRKHPLAIRGFADFMLDAFGSTPKHLFLLGKSILSANARSGLGYEMNMIPTYGEPASDAMFTAKLNSNRFVQELATGRLSAQNDADVQAYLDKVMEFDLANQQDPLPWMKNVLHFGGGTNIDEQNTLASKLSVYADIVTDTLFGGNVYTFLKNSSTPIQIDQSQYLQNLIDSGCAMMTFYGHAAGSSFDISTDDPENYNNQGRYPLVLAQSCFVGDIHTTTRLLNERFILTPQKAAIGFIAVPDKGLVEPLDTFSFNFHTVLFRDFYGTTLGEAMLKTVDRIISPDYYRKSVCMNMTLHGDPSLRLYSYEQPDLSVDGSSIFFEPSVISSSVDSFEVNIAVSNLGRNGNESFHILLSRDLPGSTQNSDTIFQVPYVSYRDTFKVRLPLDQNAGIGLNTFQVTVDVYNELAEIDDYGNNIASSQILIGSGDIDPVYPPEYAIVPNATVSLKATTSNLFAAPASYRFEVDTSPFYNSPLLVSSTVANAYGIVSWTIPFTLDSNRVYFWRVANDSILNPDTSISNDFRWKESSFMYKAGVTGWSQAHYYQLKEASLVNMLRVDSSRYFKYIQSQYSLQATHFLNRPSYDINSVNMDYGGCTGTPQIGVAVIDSIDFENPWNSDSCSRYFGNFNYYQCNTGLGCGRTRPDKFFLFAATNAAQVDSLVDFLQNDIPDGNYILSWNLWQTPFSQMSPSFFNAYAQLGANISGIQDNEKFLFFTQKGKPSSSITRRGLNPDSTLRIDYSLIRDWDKGFITSTLVGPAASWTSLHWDYESVEPGSSPDSIHLQVIGVSYTGQETLLIPLISSSTLVTSLNGIDATLYPYLRIKAYTEDLLNRTPPQLEKWQVYFDPVPEGALNTRYYTFYADTLQEGEDAELTMAFENISAVSMDTLLVDYYVYDAGNVRKNISSVRLHRDLPAGDTVMTRIKFNTSDLAGKNTLWIDVNPRNDQPEQYHFNNLTSLSFFARRDITNPLLDVTFDGTRILNGDIVSARPEIQIKLVDENRFLALNDTSGFVVRLKDPEEKVQTLNFEKQPGSAGGNPFMAWEPAVLPDNSFKIYYRPELLLDGKYQLLVQALDESGNISGKNEYRVEFEVINRSTVTEVINYPNPFSTSTRFVFTLTGSAVPSEFRIRIMTISGKVVREIGRDEIGPLRIGRNITEYAWDGRDEFGDQLANGVYLYKVDMRIAGADIEKRETEASGYFNKGWGKMYLMR